MPLYIDIQVCKKNEKNKYPNMKSNIFYWEMRSGFFLCFLFSKFPTMQLYYFSELK